MPTRDQALSNEPGWGGVIQHNRDCPAFQFEECHLWLEAQAIVTELCLDPESSIAAFVAIDSYFFFFTY